ncbi:MAG: S41 family peptidase [Polyangiaceae bacterium]
MRRRVLLGASLALAIGGLVFGVRSVPRSGGGPSDMPPAPVPGHVPSARGESDALGESDGEAPRTFRTPSGEPSAIRCETARALVAETRRELAHEPDRVAPGVFADGVVDWLDPHGLWSAAPDSPVSRILAAKGADLLQDVQGESDSGCPTAHVVGASLRAWNDELRAVFDGERAQAVARGAKDAHAEAHATVFESGAVSRPARALAKALGRNLGAFESATGDEGRAYVDAARDRYFPGLDDDGWANVVLASSVRAYVPLVDPHGAWAPPDEVASVYEVDLEAKPPGHFWEKSTRTAVGLRIDHGATPPLEDGDVVVAVAGVKTAGLPIEQIDQLEMASSDAASPAEIVVVRRGESTLRTLTMKPEALAIPAAPYDELPGTRVRYGSGEVLVVTIADVKDDLGPALTRLLLRERARDGGGPTGVLLDLRGNGGGSTDGAIAALGLFMPGVPLFPMKRRDGTIETDRAPEPPNVDRWTGPVASLVDHDTASAAEMIAGALASYRRGPVVGTNTFGKGCAQEYIEDDPDAGVLRLTTLLYALPDGLPVQRVGLAPTLRIPLDRERTAAESTEAALPHAPPTWRGPDVRDPEAMKHATDGSWTTQWPAHGGMVGPCTDTDLCRALRAMGSTATSKRAPSVRPAPR